MPDLNNSKSKQAVIAIAVCLLVAAGHHISAGERGTVGFDQLDRSTRERLDRIARESPPVSSQLKRQFETYADFSAFLISRVSLPEKEESRRADEEYQCLLNHYAVQSAPADVQKLARHLEDQLSENLKRGASRFEVFLVNDPTQTSFTLGGGRIYLSRNYFEQLYTNPKTDRDRLAFVLVHEMGHICRGHVRRRYQSEWVIEQSDLVIENEADSTAGAAVNKLLVRGVDGCLRFLYSLEEEIQADLFAFHLCRNAGYESDTILDPLRERLLAAGESQGLGPETRRLRALLFERSGAVPGEEFGLLTFDVASQQFLKADDGSVPAGARAVVFVHGMESHPQKFRKLATAVGAEGTHLLAFHYPDHGSLALAGKFLTQELNRVCPQADHLDFVCHSAGGLVFRWYAEVERGPFHQAVFIGTPHGGSSLARLRDFFDVVHFVKDFKFDETSLLEQILRDTEGQIGFDLQPGSLFLSYLDRQSDPTFRDRYSIIRGRALKRGYALLLRGSVETGQLVLHSQLAKQDVQSEWRERLQNWITKLEVPPEVSSGDLAVTLDSANLKGVKRVETLTANHIRLVDHEETIEIVREILEE